MRLVGLLLLGIVIGAVSIWAVLDRGRSSKGDLLSGASGFQSAVSTQSYTQKK
jgi:hypothetical protein